MIRLPGEKFKEAYRQEKDPRVIKRMLAASMALYKKESTQHVADFLMQCPNWVLKWVGGFEEGGVDVVSVMGERSKVRYHNQQI